MIKNFSITVVIGVIAGYLSWIFTHGFSHIQWGSLLLGFLTMSVISISGFIAFIFGRFYMIGIFKNKQKVWNGVQIFFIVLTIVDLIYLRYVHFHHPDESIFLYFYFPIFFLALSIGVSVYKCHLTSSSAWLPTLFFMTVVTTLEILPALKTNQIREIITMFFPIFLCNAWQILSMRTPVRKTYPVKIEQA